MIVSNFGIASFGIYFQIPALGFLCRVPKKDCLLSWLERQRPFFTANQNQMTGDCYRFGTWALHSKFRCHHLLTKNVQPWSNPNWRRATPKTQTMSVEKNCGPLSFPPRWIILWHPGTAWETPRTLAPKTNGWGLKITFFKGRREKKTSSKPPFVGFHVSFRVSKYQQVLHQKGTQLVPPGQRKHSSSQTNGLLTRWKSRRRSIRSHPKSNPRAGRKLSHHRA